jgi:hypothetical protein
MMKCVLLQTGIRKTSGTLIPVNVVDGNNDNHWLAVDDDFKSSGRWRMLLPSHDEIYFQFLYSTTLDKTARTHTHTHTRDSTHTKCVYM